MGPGAYNTNNDTFDLDRNPITHNVKNIKIFSQLKRLRNNDIKLNDSKDIKKYYAEFSSPKNVFGADPPRKLQEEDLKAGRKYFRGGLKKMRQDDHKRMGESGVHKEKRTEKTNAMKKKYNIIGSGKGKLVKANTLKVEANEETKININNTNTPEQKLIQTHTKQNHLKHPLPLSSNPQGLLLFFIPLFLYSLFYFLFFVEEDQRDVKRFVSSLDFPKGIHNLDENEDEDEDEDEDETPQNNTEAAEQKFNDDLFDRIQLSIQTAPQHTPQFKQNQETLWQ
jgi:hypothetical protein